MTPSKGPTAAEQAAANARKVRQRRQGAGEDAQQPEAERPARSELRTRRVRRTVDLTVNRHRELGRWCDEQADELGLTRVTSQDVLSALVDELLADDAVQRAIRDRIRVSRS